MATSLLSTPLRADEVSLQALVTPSTVILKDGHSVTFALHGFIEFKSLSEVFPYIDSQTQRLKGNSAVDSARLRLLSAELLREELKAGSSLWSMSGPCKLS